MIIKLGRYRSNYNYLKGLFEIQKPKRVGYWISMMAVSLNVPVIVVAHYVGEFNGFTDEINKMIGQLTQDYSYKGIEE